MIVPKILLSWGLLSLSLGLILSLAESTLAQTASLSDVTGVSVTTTVQNPGSTTNPGNGNTSSQVSLSTPAITSAVNNALASINTNGVSGTQTVGTVTGQSVTINVSPEAAAAIGSIISVTPVQLSGALANSLNLSNLNNLSNVTIPPGQLAGLFNNPNTAPAAQNIAALLGLNSNQPISTQIATLNQTSPQLVTYATALSLALQGLGNGGNVNPSQLLVAVRAYNGLVTTANNSPGGIAALGPRVQAIQAVLGKMVDAAYAAK